MTAATMAGLTSMVGPWTVAVVALLAAFATGWWAGQRAGKKTHAGARTAGVRGQQSLFAELGRCFADRQRRETPFSLLIVHVPELAGTGGTGGEHEQQPPALDLLTPLGGALRVVDQPFQTAADTVAIVMSSTDLCQATHVAARVQRCLLEGLSLCAAGHRPLAPACGLAEVRPEDSIVSLFERACAAAAAAAAQRGAACVTHFHDGDRPRPLVPTACHCPVGPTSE